MSDAVYIRELPGGRALVGWSALALVAMCAAILAADGAGEEGLRAVIRATARTSLVLFAAAFAASGLRRVWRSPATAWLLRNRRYVGLSFAISHALHLAAILAVAATVPGFAADVDATTVIGGGAGYVLIAAMALTSNDTAVRRLGPRRWRALHVTGLWVVFGIFTTSYLGRALESPLYLPHAGAARRDADPSPLAVPRSCRLRSMDFTFSEAEQAYRDKARAWIQAHIPQWWKDADAHEFGDEDAMFDGIRRWHQELYDAGYVGVTWPVEYGGQGRGHVENALLAGRARAAERAARDQRPRHRPVRSRDRPPRKRRAEEALPAPDAARGRDVVSGLLGARRGIGPREPAHDRRAARRPLRGERPEDLDRRWRTAPTGSSAWCAPTRRRTSTRASGSC